MPRLRSGAFDCSWRSALLLVSRFALWGFHPPRFVFVAGCGWRLWSVFVFWRSGASARPGVSFVFEVLPPVLLLFLLAAAVVFCPLMPVAAVPLLVPCGFCPPWGVFLLVVVPGVCCLVLWASWGCCPPWAVCFCFCCCCCGGGGGCVCVWR